MPPLEIPDRGDPDRKRALNVLAQRRYRQRKRERMIELEKRARSSSASSASPGTIHSATDTQSEESNAANPGWIQNGATASPSYDNFIQDPSSQFQAGPSTADFNSNPTLANSICGPEGLSGLEDFDLDLFLESGAFGHEVQTLEASQFDFPDDAIIDIPELRVRKAGYNLAELFRCSDTIFDLSSLRIIDDTTLPSINLPPNLLPTPLQQRIPHHPLFDILPWPSVRNNLIILFSQPPQLRPPIARDPMALMNLSYDLDDPVEGMRITGADWRDGDNWEIGPLFFKNWWFILDRQVLASSNALRKKRGLSRLTLPTAAAT